MRQVGARHCAMSCFNLAHIHFDLCQYDAALPLYHAALECHALAAHGGRVDGETLDVAATLTEMALVYEIKGQFDKAWELSLRAADRGHARDAAQAASRAQGDDETATHAANVDNTILKIQTRLRARKRLNQIWSAIRHRGVKDWDPLWVPDESVTACNVCRKEFSLLRRRHHCRMCGAVVCAKCSHHPRGKRICSNCKLGSGTDALARRSEAGASDWFEIAPFEISSSSWSSEGWEAVAMAPGGPRRGEEGGNEFWWKGHQAGAGACGGWDDSRGNQAGVAGSVECEDSDLCTCGAQHLVRLRSARVVGGTQTVRHWLTAQSAASEAVSSPKLTVPDFTAENFNNF
jgi:hypothetical protein